MLVSIPRLIYWIIVLLTTLAAVAILVWAMYLPDPFANSQFGISTVLLLGSSTGVAIGALSIGPAFQEKE